jgi:ATPase family AAA domain-containing protein 3A/B
MLILAGIALILLMCYYMVKEPLSMLRQFIQSRIGRPSLVRETSYHWSIVPVFISSLFARKEKLSTTFKAIEDSFQNIILSKEDKQNLAVDTRNTRNSGAPYRHVMLHGPPGTGKTLVARKLAQVSGMDYAIMSGGDVAPLGEDAVNQLHNLFKWAARSRKGLLLFVDEAEALLASRSHNSNNNRGGSNNDGSNSGGGGGGGSADIHMRNALNALLYQTGMPSTSFMLVLATNRPGDLDSAVLDRMDISLQISLPGLDQRIDLVKLYMRSYVLDAIRAAQTRGPAQGVVALSDRGEPLARGHQDARLLGPRDRKAVHRSAVRHVPGRGL